MPTPVTRASSRIRSLDGLRGVAAAVVVVHHSLLAVPALSTAYYPSEGDDFSPPAWLATFTPLHLLWAGGEAVFVFFVLSGLVLTLPFLKSTVSWRRYYPSRMIRLYLPVVGAVIFGYLLVFLVPRSEPEGLGPWLAARPNPAGIGVLQDLSLIFGITRVISPFWSLRWEVIFSLALPAFVWFGIHFRRFWYAKVAAILATVFVGSVVVDGFLTYLPMFAVGTLIAVHLETLKQAATRIPRWGWYALVALTVIALTSQWLVGAFYSSAQEASELTVVVLVGAAGAVFISAFWRPAVSFLQLTPVHWLGTVSFSLYLVHEPIVIATAFLLGPGWGWLTLPIAAPVSVLAAWLFFRFVERPSHRLAKLVASKIPLRAQP
jgi:peptidoglycan/LPS O-acetylase OafA/YrhL